MVLVSMAIEPKLGLTPEEMITAFNRMYRDSWERSRDQVDWHTASLSKQIKDGEEVDLSNWLLGALEIAVSACRDAMAFTLIENNQRISQQLMELEVPVPMEETDDQETNVEMDFDSLA